MQAGADAETVHRHDGNGLHPRILQIIEGFTLLLSADTAALPDNDYAMIFPPAIRMELPSMYAERSSNRNATTSPISSGLPI